jgi:porin
MLSSAPARAQVVTPQVLMTANALSNPVGGERQSTTYTHQLVGGATVKPEDSSDWQVTVSGAWTAGKSLTANAIGDTSGVQGTYNGGNGFWLYQLELRRTTEHSELAIGRLAASDSFGVLAGFSNFVNAAFSSNGGAISINDPGRATSPSSTWGVTAKAVEGPFALKVGAFLSNPNCFALNRHGRDFALRPGDGVIAMVEATAALSPSLNVGLGGYHDTAPVTLFDGSNGRGNNGAYAWVERPAVGAGPSLFVMAQVAPKADRNVYPVFVIAGATWSASRIGRPDDRTSIGAHAGRFSRESGHSGWEAVMEIDYQYKLDDKIVLQPDLQYIVRPGGEFSDAIVVGAQVSFHL